MFNKRPRPSAPNVYRDALFLTDCSVAEVRDWFERRETSYSPVRGVPETPADAHVLEYLLFRRNDPQIDLILAENGRSRSVLERIYSRGKLSIKAVLCANASLFVGDNLGRSTLLFEEEPLFWKIILKGSLSELRALCQNPNLSNGMYEGLLRSWIGNKSSRVDASCRTSDNRFMQILRFLSENPRIKKNRDESHQKYYWDGYSNYTYSILFSECWHLAEIVPVNDEWALCLHEIYSKMRPEYNPYKDLSAVLARWFFEGEETYSETVTLRQVLIAHFVSPNISTLNHTDEAYRRAFYETFDPDDEDIIELNWMDWRKRDKYCEFELQNNRKVWKSRRGRRKLEWLLIEASKENSEVTQLGWFHERLDSYRAEHPDWFAEEEVADDNVYDPHESRMAIKEIESKLSLINPNRNSGLSDFIIEAERNELIGSHALRDDIGDFGKKGLPLYRIDDDTRDRILAHVREDLATTLGHAKSAFRTAKEAANAAKDSRLMLWVVIALLAYLVYLVE